MLDRNNGFDKHYYQVRLPTALDPTTQLIRTAGHWHLCQHKVPLTQKFLVTSQLMVPEGEGFCGWDLFR